MCTYVQGTLTFVRIYSGTLETGTFVSNPNKGKKERIGRIQLMHANNREDIKVHSLVGSFQTDHMFHLPWLGLHDLCNLLRYYMQVACLAEVFVCGWDSTS